MPKLIALIPRHPGVSAPAFRTYYEEQHVPLLLDLLPTMRSYTRNYPRLDDARIPEGQSSLGFDAVTEVRFDEQTEYDAFLQRLQLPEVRAMIRADEAKFCNSAGVVRFLVDEVTSRKPLGD